MEDKNNPLDNSITGQSDNVTEPGKSFSPVNSPSTTPIGSAPPNTNNINATQGSKSFLSNGQTSQPNTSPSVPNPLNEIQPSINVSSAQSGASPSVFTVKKKNKKLKLLVLVGLAIVMIGGGGAYAYYKQQNSPENLIAQSMINLVSSEKMGANLLMKMSSEGTDMTIGVDMKSDSKQKVGEGSINFTIDSFDVSGIKLSDLNFSVNGIMKDDKAYVKIGDFQKVVDGVFSSFFVGISSAEQQETVKELKAFADTLHQTITSKWLVFDLKDKIQGIPDSCNSDILKQTSQSDRDKIQSSYKANQFVTIKEKKGSEKIKEINTEHYVIGLNAEKLNKFADSMESTESTKAVAKCLDELGSQFKIEEISKNNEIKQEDLPQDIEVWMNRKNKTLQRVKFPLKDKETTIGDMTMEMDYITQVNPTIPEDAITYQELMTKISQDINSSPFIKAFLESLGVPVEGI